MSAKLITYTPIPEHICGLAAALCYNSPDPDSALESSLGSGHQSVVEHATFSFLVEGVSRSLLAQITRHRIASFRVQSQRYVDMSDKFNYIVPPNIKALRPSAEAEFMYQMGIIHGWYKEWQDQLLAAGHTKGEANEDARFVLPNATETKFIVTMNIRELFHLFELRCCNRAQWEIRQLAWEMLNECKKASPTLFVNAGPSCVRGSCPEGKLSCRKPYTVFD